MPPVQIWEFGAALGGRAVCWRGRRRRLVGCASARVERLLPRL